MFVLLYHHFDVFMPGNAAGAIINHGYLAVDFFFILSGYVIGYAYDDRWDRMGHGEFLKRRVIRLHPLIVLSTVLGIMLFYFGISEMFPLIKDTGAWKLLWYGVLAIFMIPTPTSIDIRGWDEMNAINGNACTLFFEYIAYILYAFAVRRLSNFWLCLFVGLTSFLTINLAFDIDIFGILGERAGQSHTVIGGWTLNAEGVLIGFSRLLFPFFAGLLLARMGWKIRIRNGFFWCSLFLSALLVLPRVSSEPFWNGIYEAACIILLFPLLVMMGAGSTVSGSGEKVCKFLGDISYPLYILQYPVVYTLLGGWKCAHPDATTDQIILVNVSCFLLSVAIAYGCLRLYDEPLRRKLSQHWLKRRGNRTQTK